MKEADRILGDAYNRLDESKKKLKRVKNLLWYNDDDDEATRDEIGHDNYFKMKEI